MTGKMDAMEWLRTVRGLKDELLLDMGVRAVHHRRLGDGLAFPYVRRGERYADKFRTVDKQFASTTGVSRGLYNEDALLLGAALPVIITEGEIDALSCIQAGFDRSVAVPDGWTEKGNKTDALVAAEKGLRDSPYVIVASDADDAGESLPRAVANILKGHDVRRAVWPDGCKDANDVLMKHGSGELTRCLYAAQRIDPPGGLITGLSDLPPLSDRRVLRIRERPFEWAVALELGALSVWTGTPGSGKSTFLTWVASKVAQSENIRVGMLAFETHPHDIRDQLCLIRAGREYGALSEDFRAKLMSELDREFRLVHATPEGDMQQHLGWLESMVYTLAIRDQCKLIVIDPWNELEHLPNPGETMTSYVNYATKVIRQWAERLEVHIALVAHPRKMPTDFARPPTGYDIADSAAFFNKPSLGVTVYPRKETDKESGQTDDWVELHIWKVRKTRLYGFERGKVDVEFDRERMSYRPRNRGERA